MCEVTVRSVGEVRPLVHHEDDVELREESFRLSVQGSKRLVRRGQSLRLVWGAVTTSDISR